MTKHRVVRASLISLYLSPVMGALWWLWASLAWAGVSCTLPFNLQNGTTADATQVMANYNAVVTWLGNSAAAGANNDITSLLGLTTPLSRTEGGSSVYIGSTATNVANVYSFSSTIPTNFSLSVGNIVSFIAPSTNTGATQIVAAGTASTNLFRQTATGPVAMVGGEIQPNQVVIAYYDGTEFQCINCPNLAAVPTGVTLDFSGVIIPTGFLAANGAAISRTNFSVLYSALAYQNISATTNGTSTITIAAGTSNYQVGWYVGANLDVPCNSFISSIPDGTHIVINNIAASGSPTLTIGPYQQGDCSTTFNLPNYTGKLLASVDGSQNITSTPITTVATFTNGSPIIGSPNGLRVGQGVSFNTSGSLPANFSVGVTYFVVSAGLSNTQFEVALTPGGTAITAGSTGSGSQSVNIPICANAGSIGDKTQAPNIGCGGQFNSITVLSQLPPFTPSGVVASSSNATGNNGSLCGVGTGATTGMCGQITQTITSTFTGSQVGGSTPTPTLPPIGEVIKIIKT